MAIKRPSGKMAFNPSSDAMLEASDILIALGDRKSLDELERLAST